MRFHHTIEVTDNAEDPIWHTEIEGEDVEEYNGTSTQYGREVLENWLIDQANNLDAGSLTVTDEYGNPYYRVAVRFAGNPDEQDNPIATVGSDEPDTDTPAELDAVDAARDAKLYAKYLDRSADDQLEEALMTARESGHGSNELARRVAPAVSRPIALRLMQAH
ncbi:hypothetical protein [Streptomyces axinellae]|uniref:Uncharacterized protein n=1 Tax=Streptomyces axinellae TaxID=552788 RepID=A0ABN3QM67_9ACTN